MDLMTVLQNREKWKKQQQLGEINQRIQNHTSVDHMQCFGDATARLHNALGQSEDKDEKNDDEDLAEADEEESDLDLAWKMVDAAIAATRRRKKKTS
ncbi:hypothetical protein SADUNF_Sadunf17G0136000 [Salix dunnii]|uniref:Uncharacterized protein n=1 Tax=Salix dunnii TaxID=1413687 RepID=A0A835J9J9_9ROSI|nr:hypothetical protein SADUNF_Sadunf17G0136000 [Salix dunnii]